MNCVLLTSLFVLSFSATLFNQGFSINDYHSTEQPNNFSPRFPCLWIIDQILQPLLNFPPFFSSPPPDDSEPLAEESPMGDPREDKCNQLLVENVHSKCFDDMLKSFYFHKVLIPAECCPGIMAMPDYCFKEVIFVGWRDVSSKIKEYCSKELAATPST
ncbi:hypothetical protein ES288_A08G260500v1 [Gossypium darwinii]|uniref:Prolamin-like domain-containing protein n=2 Tax=Gossypium TaxID=3633 RepID=A0A5D2PKK7_GOSTO|nr:hypothetical protein ES288_A08G260500v1 [Gossypium darwinii]TYI16492.1 hypothetical protein ES332_A08G259300v1 [Gossypium tomentosum]